VQGSIYADERLPLMILAQCPEMRIKCIYGAFCLRKQIVQYPNMLQQKLIRLIMSIKLIIALIYHHHKLQGFIYIELR
jgi:hypothetical protein